MSVGKSGIVTVKFCVEKFDGSKFWKEKLPWLLAVVPLVLYVAVLITAWVALFVNFHSCRGIAAPSTLTMAVPAASSKHWNPAKTTEAPNA